MHEAFFFGPSDRQLFASYHPPTQGDGRILTVICPPLFREYMRAWTALRKVALSLAERGQHVLRLDYRGTGDSFGELTETTLSDWVDDITLAVEEGRELSGSRAIQLLGVRAGALLAGRAATEIADLKRLVLWDPVPSGKACLEALHEVQVERLKSYRLSRAEYQEALLEYAGHRLSEPMLEEFRLLSSNVYSDIPHEKLHIVSTTPSDDFPVEPIARRVAQFSCQWDTDTEKSLSPSIVTESLIECLTQS